METANVGDVVWFCQLNDRVGPLPAIVVEGGTRPSLVVFRDNTLSFVSSNPWDVEDGTDYGWLRIPAGGIIPPDLFD
jgi:hypothetical protein